jgi:deazaflavin-dependent oxidoreductase (nitroreductase family)
VVPVSWFYREGRARRWWRWLSAAYVWWASLGLPPRRQVGLEVRGRKSGQPHRIPVVVATVDGERYLVSMVGEKEWVRNVRAAGGEATIISGGRRAVTLVDVPVEERAPVIKEYLRVAPGGRPHIGLRANASLEECAGVAAAHPVFRIVEREG